MQVRQSTGSIVNDLSDCVAPSFALRSRRISGQARVRVHVVLRPPKRFRRTKTTYVLVCDASGQKQVRPKDPEDRRFVVASIVCPEADANRTADAWSAWRSRLAPGVDELKARDFFSDRHEFTDGLSNAKRHLLLQGVISEVLEAGGAYVLAIDFRKQSFGNTMAEAEDGVGSVSPLVLPGRRTAGKVNDAVLFSTLGACFGAFLLRKDGKGRLICDAEGSESDQQVIQREWSNARVGYGLEGRAYKLWEQDTKPAYERVADVIEFRDSASSDLVQVADLIAGAICYASQERVPVGGQLLREFKTRSLAVGLGLVHAVA